MPSGSFSRSQPNAAAATASRKITSEENVAGKRAERDRDQALPADLRDDREREQRGDALHRLRQDARLERESR